MFVRLSVATTWAQRHGLCGCAESPLPVEFISHGKLSSVFKHSLSGPRPKDFI